MSQLLTLRMSLHIRKAGKPLIHTVLLKLHGQGSGMCVDSGVLCCHGVGSKLGLHTKYSSTKCCTSCKVKHARSDK
eukprot:scaffold240937_cov27-Tisochrysis_lutea.AAC.1